MELKNGEVICSRCKGKGFTNEDNLSIGYYSPCYKCSGLGVVDWITNIVGSSNESEI